MLVGGQRVQAEGTLSVTVYRYHHSRVVVLVSICGAASIFYCKQP
jgi:hypothetical protein